jgi:hypothetical protein
VSFHHAGLSQEDRAAVESGFLQGNINVICCTSTLAVGVNLPCHFVIVKGTMTYQNNTLIEMSDLEVMQMLGRAGRPQFDRNAVAVIMTRQETLKRWEKLVSGEEILESWYALRTVLGKLLTLDQLTSQFNRASGKDAPLNSPKVFMLSIYRMQNLFLVQLQTSNLRKTGSVVPFSSSGFKRILSTIDSAVSVVTVKLRIFWTISAEET